MFKGWHAQKYNAKRDEKARLDRERQKKGILSGREIFLQAGFTAMDDASASEEYSREVDIAAEEREMQARAEEALAASQSSAGSVPWCFEDQFYNAVVLEALLLFSHSVYSALHNNLTWLGLEKWDY